MNFYALKNPAPKKVKDNNNFETKEKHDERQREEEWKKCNSKKKKENSVTPRAQETWILILYHRNRNGLSKMKMSLEFLEKTKYAFKGSNKLKVSVGWKQAAATINFFSFF